MTKEVLHPDYPDFLASLKEPILHARIASISSHFALAYSDESIWQQPVAKLLKCLSSGQSQIWPQSVAISDESLAKPKAKFHALIAGSAGDID